MMNNEIFLKIVDLLECLNSKMDRVVELLSEQKSSHYKMPNGIVTYDDWSINDIRAYTIRLIQMIYAYKYMNLTNENKYDLAYQFTQLQKKILSYMEKLDNIGKMANDNELTGTINNIINMDKAFEVAFYIGGSLSNHDADLLHTLEIYNQFINQQTNINSITVADENTGTIVELKLDNACPFSFNELMKLNIDQLVSILIKYES